MKCSVSSRLRGKDGGGGGGIQGTACSHLYDRFGETYVSEEEIL